MFSTEKFETSFTVVTVTESFDIIVFVYFVGLFFICITYMEKGEGSEKKSKENIACFERFLNNATKQKIL